MSQVGDCLTGTQEEALVVTTLYVCVTLCIWPTLSTLGNYFRDIQRTKCIINTNRLELEKEIMLYNDRRKKSNEKFGRFSYEVPTKNDSAGQKRPRTDSPTIPQEDN